jgi:hypothetical protein
MYEHELKERIPDPELLLKLEPEELAGVLLSILRKEGTNYQGRISGYNFCNSFRQMQEIYPRQAVPAVTRAIMERSELGSDNPKNWSAQGGPSEVSQAFLRIGSRALCPFRNC